MNKLTTLAILGILSLGTVCMAMASDCGEKGAKPGACCQDDEVVVVETVSCTACTAAPCAKDAVCKDKTKCKDHVKKCAGKVQKKECCKTCTPAKNDAKAPAAAK